MSPPARADGAALPMMVMGLDGKHYPGHRLGPADRLRLIERVHYLSHHESLSVRKIRARLAEHGIRRSVGWVSEALRRWRCDHCSGGSKGTT